MNIVTASARAPRHAAVSLRRTARSALFDVLALIAFAVAIVGPTALALWLLGLL